jgi:YbbR domain-containing protein
MRKQVIINGKKEKLAISIDQESVNIYIDKGETKDPIHVVYYHMDEIEEDASVAIPMVNAVHLFHTHPQELVDRIFKFRK